MSFFRRSGNTPAIPSGVVRNYKSWEGSEGKPDRSLSGIGTDDPSTFLSTCQMRSCSSKKPSNSVQGAQAAPVQHVNITSRTASVIQQARTRRHGLKVVLGSRPPQPDPAAPARVCFSLPRHFVVFYDPTSSLWRYVRGTPGVWLAATAQPRPALSMPAPRPLLAAQNSDCTPEFELRLRRPRCYVPRGTGFPYADWGDG
ncbi:hypothetical protein L227DRAFT_604438 [Lentinus tigrinus ALCF2SS1-6]|uniref:Uncharacterized protein n=1 Tax=Lentinus tigrinus ALCF2SS1-6 TaxID=1328759 RepID=A0A5C2RRG6_9APHY|nr:hypothetical protein L227DRAFT_604438 [Lentinus tigrinus ALCF2SS1-6]